MAGGNAGDVLENLEGHIVKQDLVHQALHQRRKLCGECLRAGSDNRHPIARVLCTVMYSQTRLLTKPSYPGLLAWPPSLDHSYHW